MDNKVTPFLWFNDQALDAARFYVSVFKQGSKVLSSSKGPDGKVMSATFRVRDQVLFALNGGPHYKLTPAFSLYVSCQTQKQVDDLWGKLTKDGGAESRCGWCVDKFGVSWQIIPDILQELISSKDRAAAGRAMQAMMKMGKIDIAALKAAHGPVTTSTTTTKKKKKKK